MYILLSYCSHNVNLSKALLLLESGFYSNTLTLNVENNWNLSSQPVNQLCGTTSSKHVDRLFLLYFTPEKELFWIYEVSTRQQL